ncbi:MAG: glycosyltransferase [Ilumatobacter sp.]|nr:glycosyltransferase [Ilumatobacter sp.]
MTVSIVVPCFNEARRLDLDAFRSLADAVDEVRFVDDGSTDATPATLAALAEERPDRIVVQSLRRNAGKAEAVRLGMLAAIDAGHSIVGFLDADLATPTHEIARLVDIAGTQPQRTAVIGSRVALLGHAVHRRPARHYLGRLYATVASLALGVAVYDTQCGAKVFRVGIPLQLALADSFHDPWSFDVELLGRLLSHPGQAADPILEVPLFEWRDVDGSQVRAAAGLRASVALLGLRSRVRRHRRRYAS